MADGMMTQVPLTLNNAPSQLRLIIVGAGISGLAASIACAMSGHIVTVFEAAKELAEIGAGLQLTPNSTKILQQWDLPDWFWASGVEPGCFAVHRYSGEVLSSESDFDKSMRNTFGAPFMDVRRIDLQKALYDRAKQLRVEFIFSHKVVAVNSEQTGITTASGDEHHADLIIAADGVWSQCRANFIQDDEISWQPSGEMVYRLVYELDYLSDPKLRDLVSNPEVHMWIGPGAHAIGYSLKAGNGYNLGFVVQDDMPEGINRQSCPIEDVKRRFRNWDPSLTCFLDHVTTVEKWKLLQRDGLSSWVSPNSNLVFVGDSCHPMLPYVAQGANTAIEDGAVLGALLAETTSTGGLCNALRLYEDIRKPRAQRIVGEARAQRDVFLMPDGPEQEARDKVLRSQHNRPGRGPSPVSLICSETQEWLYGYDVQKEVGGAVQLSVIEHKP